MSIRSFFCPLLLLLGCCMCYSCDKLVESPTAGNRLTISGVFADDAGAQSAMSGVYISMMNNTTDLMNGGIGLDAGLSADELICTPLYQASLLQEYLFQRDSLTAATPQCLELFATAYNLIYDLNSLLEGIAASANVSGPVRTRLEGEAMFNRALLYFYLVNLYGGVPVVLTTDYTVSGSAPRVSRDSVFSQIVSDLLDAQQMLPAGYLDASGALTKIRARPDQAAATALLARVWLYEGQWVQAEAAATMVIGDPRYQLCGSLDSVFLSSSPEAIWQLQPVYGKMATGDALTYLAHLPPGPPLYEVSPVLLGSMEAGDMRQQHWTHSIVHNGQTYIYPYKYKQLADSTGDPEYEMVLRLAEQYLIRAEARVRQGNVDGAIADLDVIRARAGLGATTATQLQDVLAAILHERRIELMTEWGHRWLDLKRTGEVDSVLNAKEGWVSSDTLYPIPTYELLTNPGMLQNPGY